MKPVQDQQRMPEIYCTLGNTSDGNIEDMIEAGMKGARINTAYCSHDDYTKRITEVRTAAKKANVEVPIMVDLKGPQLRIETYKGSSYAIDKGTILPFGFNVQEAKTNGTDINLNYDISACLEKGDEVDIDNADIKTRVVSVSPTIELEVIHEGKGYIQNGVGVNIPNKSIDVPCLSEKDKSHVAYCALHSIEQLALSFVRTKADVEHLQNYAYQEFNYHPQIIAKIENLEGLKALEEITEVADMIMIARGDLFNELPYEKLAQVQQYIATTCKSHGKPCMIATGILESMKKNEKPTRAEIGDVWNALRDKPQSFLLSAETSNGKYPVEAVMTLTEIMNNYAAINNYRPSVKV